MYINIWDIFSFIWNFSPTWKILSQPDWSIIFVKLPPFCVYLNIFSNLDFSQNFSELHQKFKSYANAYLLQNCVNIIYLYDSLINFENFNLGPIYKIEFQLFNQKHSFLLEPKKNIRNTQLNDFLFTTHQFPQS